MISKCELVFFSHFRMNMNAGTCWSRLFLAHFTTLFRMVTKSSIKQIFFPWLVQGKILDTWTAFCSLFCMPKPLPNVGVLLACWRVISGSLVGVPRMCRRLLKFAYDVVRVWMGKIYSLLVRGVSRSKRLIPLILSQSSWMLFITTINN